jgi:hypothetical protein
MGIVLDAGRQLAILILAEKLGAAIGLAARNSFTIFLPCLGGNISSQIESFGLTRDEPSQSAQVHDIFFHIFALWRF